MKKKQKTNTKNTIAITLYFIGALVSMNVLDTLLFHILGVAMLIAALYGIVAQVKGGEFLFS